MDLKRFEMLWPADLMAEVDAWRGQHANPPTRAVAIRTLVERGLRADPPAAQAAPEKVAARKEAAPVRWSGLKAR